MSASTIKSTININRYYKEQLEYLVQINELDSVTEGINIAIENYVKEKQKELYAQKMKDASMDEEFINRTLRTQKLFEKSDADVDNIIHLEDLEW